MIRSGLLQSVGEVTLWLIGRLSPDAAEAIDAGYRERDSGSEASARRLGFDCILAVLTAFIGSVVVGLPLGVGLAALWPAIGWRTRRARRLAGSDALRRGLPEAYGLLAVAAASGLNAYRSIEVVAESVQGPVGVLFGSVMADIRGGAPVAEAVGRCSESSELRELASLARAVASAERQGSPLAPSLQRLADDAAERRRRRAEAEARKAPVRILFPLVTCVLPSFVLLTVVPVFADTFSLVRG